MNIFKTGLLMGLMMGLFLVVGAVIGGAGGMMVAFVIAAGLNLMAYWNSDKMLLHMYGARQVDAASAPDLYHIVEQLAANARLPMPKVFISENPQPNAFATGRSPEHAAVCVTSGLLQRVSNDELAGVIAPFAAMLVQSAISRSREFEADRAGAELTGRPLWLANALAAIDSSAQRIDNPSADANPATAHMFIINPLHGGFSGLFASHPSTQERIARLRAMAGETAETAAGPWA